MSNRITAPSLRLFKSEGRKIVACTGYDALDVEFLELAGIDVILVGDSVANVRLGLKNTVFVTLEQMCHHVAAAARSIKNSLLVADLPFGSYGGSVEQAFDSASVLMRCGAHCVKLEGDYPEVMFALQKAGIPVIGHLGMTPQSVNKFGGHKVQGRGDADSERLLGVAKGLEEAGASAIVLELIPAELAKSISQSLSIPTIGIGAGPHCDGEIQVLTDLLGFEEKVYKHAKPYMNGRDLCIQALATYADEVRNRKFPTEENSF